MFMKWVDLGIEQKKSLDYKIERAMESIRNATSVFHHRIALAFSGGKDSTVLADIIRRFLPKVFENIHFIYGNTGVEYPECVEFSEWFRKEHGLNGRFHVTRPEKTDRPGLKYNSQRKVWEWAIGTGRIADILKPDGKLKSTEALESLASQMPNEDSLTRWPEGTTKNYFWCTDQYGWPLLGKAWSRLVARRINIDTFLKFSKSASTNKSLLSYYQVLRQVKISQACCSFLKKDPAIRMGRELDVDLILKGLMAAESRSRTKNFLSRGYLFEGAKQEYLKGDPFFHCQPLAIWTDQDIWDYINRYKVPYSKLYDMGYTDKFGGFHKIKRNGCMGCATDLLFPQNHMSLLRKTHPKVWHLFMKKGMAKEIINLQIAKRNGQESIFDLWGAERILEERPCYFDSITTLTLDSDTDEFDPET